MGYFGVGTCYQIYFEYFPRMKWTVMMSKLEHIINRQQIFMVNACVMVILQVAEEWEKNTFEIRPLDEDIHTANERRLKVGNTSY